MAFFRNFRIHAHGVHVLLTLYNGIIVFLLAFFMGITQKKINLSMSAGSFLQQVPVLPVPADERLAYALAAFGVLAGCGYIYSNAGRLPWPLRYAVFVLEMSLCIFLMHILNLAYDGVVLLLIADLMYCYQGRHQMIVMLLAMAVVYFVISYNVSLWQMKVVPFEVYAGYYNHEVQSMLLPLKNLLTYGNITIFVIYMVVLIQD
ncbi:MAG: sensor histidine kinase, partial [Anaerovibrio sp.]|nr:sensor histidine kinase [Anaerovibrio sp.]